MKDKMEQAKVALGGYYEKMKDNRSEFVMVKSLVNNGKTPEEIEDFLELNEALKFCYTMLYTNNMRELHNVVAEKGMYGEIKLYDKSGHHIDFSHKAANRKPDAFIKLFNETKIKKKIK